MNVVEHGPAEGHAQREARGLKKVQINAGVQGNGSVESAPVGEFGYLAAAEDLEIWDQILEPEMETVLRAVHISVIRRLVWECLEGVSRHSLGLFNHSSVADRIPCSHTPAAGVVSASILSSFHDSMSHRASSEPSADTLLPHTLC